MGFCQWFVIVIYLLDLGVHLAKHGERKESRYNFWSTLIATIIMMAIFKCGGFFD